MKFIDVLKKLTRPKNIDSVESPNSRVSVDINYVESKLTPDDFKPKSESKAETDTANVE